VAEIGDLNATAQTLDFSADAWRPPNRSYDAGEHFDHEFLRHFTFQIERS
jgi:hypothetical protein